MNPWLGGLFFLGASVNAAPNAVPAFTAEHQSAVLLMEAMRLPPAAFADYVESPDPAARARAARALGRLRVAEALPALGALAEDADATVRSEAAFALGQTPGSESSLLTLLSRAERPSQRALLCAGLGKQGTSASVPVLVRHLAEEPAPLHPPEVAEAAAIALGRLHMRGTTEAGSEEVVLALIGQLQRLDLRARRAAAFALGRIRPPSLSNRATDALFAAASRERDVSARTFLLRATAALTNAEDRKSRLYGEAARDSSPRVRVAVARAGGLARWREVAGLLQDIDPGVRREAIAAVGQVESLDRLALLLPIVARGADLAAAEDQRTHGATRLTEAAEALTALATAGLVPELAPYLGPDRPDAIREAALAGYADVPRLVALATDDDSARVRVAAAGRLVELKVATAAYLPLLLARDPVVATAAADHLTERPDRAAESTLVRLLQQPVDPDLTRSAAKALAALYPEKKNQIGKQKVSPALIQLVSSLGKNADPEIVEAAGVLADAFKVPRPQAIHQPLNVPLDQLARIRGARIRTSRGEVLLRLYPDEAPVTVWNFVRLAEDGYYDGLSIHRVVPDFVVQDGDPRGDGTGGPGWSIPDEINPLRYDEGMLGMALSGPDTGGSQWFVTLSPQPHLDGTYTIFGEVTDGLGLLRTVQPGDRIERVLIERSAVPAP